jgi:hypothetical protein
LADAIRAVLSLPMVGRHPIEIVKDHLSRGSKVQADTAGLDMAKKRRTLGSD